MAEKIIKTTLILVSCTVTDQLGRVKAWSALSGLVWTEIEQLGNVLNFLLNNHLSNARKSINVAR